MRDRAAFRTSNFFKSTMRDPDAHSVPDAAEVEALAVVKTNIEAQALSQGRTLNSVQLDRALSVAQRLIRALPRDQLHSIASNSSLLKIITDQSLAVAPITDPRTAAAHPLGAQGHDAGAAQLSGALIGQRGIDGSDRRSNYAALSGSLGHLTESERRNYEALQPFAKLHGLDWMPPRDMLAIGRDGLKAIAETNLKQAGYTALRQGSLYEAKDVVAFAKHAKLRGFDAEKTAHAQSALVQAQPEEQRKQLADVLKAFDQAAAVSYANPNDAAARQRLEEAGQRQKAALQAIADKSAEDAERVRKFQQEKKIEERFQANTAAARAKAEVKVTTAEVKETKNDDLLAAINEPTPPKTEAPKADAKTTPAKAPAAAAPKGPKQ